MSHEGKINLKPEKIVSDSNLSTVWFGYGGFVRVFTQKRQKLRSGSGLRFSFGFGLAIPGCEKLPS